MHLCLLKKLLGCGLLVLPLLAKNSKLPKSLETLLKEEDSYTRLVNKHRRLKQKNGGYFGVGLGMINIKKNYKNTKLESFPIILSLKGGLQTFFEHYVGIRVFFALDLATSKANWLFKATPSTSFFGMASAGFEIPMEFSLTRSFKHFLGFYGGVGAGAVIYADRANFQIRNKQAIYDFGLVIQGGMVLTLYSKHRIEAGFKVLPADKNTQDSQRFATSLMFSLMYLYKF
ncbi:putative outer membrane protein [Helicobacter bizzozeronii CIII-1]|uniref:Putative outer membrane protein n=1 Tax=Helicobacter bizzozeronii (strain CIII-1) TaxID=1002804 RepID=F8KSK0_HELBC|nr:putative outer membrane protein [Helicobacter bizzozeronii CIII-1]